MKDSFTKELIELAAQAATIEQLNVVIKARDMRILELEDELAIAHGLFNELKSIVSKCQPDEVCIDNALLYLEQLEGKTSE